jgi:Leucine-rich repeat (LRR) protein
MKKLLLRTVFSFLIFHSSFFISKAQWVSIPDTNFGTWLKTNYSSCMQGNNTIGWQMDTTCPAIVADTTVDCSGAVISDLTGIGYFDELKYLDCSGNFIATLPVLPSHLETLFVLNNAFTVLTGLPSSLTYLDITNNPYLTSITALPPGLTILDGNFNPLLTSLPALPSGLIRLTCRGAQLSSLPALPSSLLRLECGGNPLNSLPALPPGLFGLFCWSNQLTSLPALPSTLTELDCSNNQLTGLPALPAGLTSLDCSYNPTISLPALPTGLATLNCRYNSLTSLPALPSGLSVLYCDSNQLSSLPALPAGLWDLDCSGNHLTGLPEFPDSLHYCYISDNPITCLPRLKYIYSFDFENTLVTCLPNYGNVISDYPLLSSLPLCDSANANGCGYCHAFFSVQTDSFNTGIYTGFNQSYGSNLTSYLWEFGDGDTSSLPYPSHNYAQPGQYYVCLTVSGADCSNTYCDSSFYVFKTEGGLMSALHIIDPATGISKTETTHPQFAISPNPAGNIVSINIDESMIGGSVTVRDITGRRVAAIKPEAQSSKLEVQSFSNGVYFVTVTKEGRSATKKLIIEK